MPRVQAVLLDLDGVLYVGNALLPGAREAMARLRAAGLPLRFLTNTTRTPRRLLLEKLAGLGIDAAPEELFTPATAARQYLASRGLAPHLVVHPALAEDFAGLPATGQGEQAVILGDAGDAFSYAAMNQAYRALAGGAEFLALANNRCFRDADGGLSLDAGPFVAALEFATRREPLVLGKPARGFFKAALASVGAEPDQAVMIGDDVESDVAGAMAIGCAGVLVRTGKYEPGAEVTITPPPTAVAAGIGEAVEWVLGE